MRTIDYDPSPGRLFVISDTHFEHDNIVRYCDRPFEHNEIMVERWNNTVGADDTVLHLGDFAFGGIVVVRDYLSVLNGKKLLLRGNHDRAAHGSYLDAGFAEVFRDSSIKIAAYPRLVFSHKPLDVSELDPGVLNVHGHTHNTTVDDRRHLNLSVECTSYTPVPIETVMVVAR